MSEEYICIKECFYGPPGYRVHYKPGDPLRTATPGKHFVPASEFNPRKLNPWPENELHDKRSTVQILSDLKHKYDIVLDPNSTSRQEAFMAWRGAEDRARASLLKGAETRS